MTDVCPSLSSSGLSTRREFFRLVGGTAGLLVAQAGGAVFTDEHPAGPLWRLVGAGGGGWLPCLAVSPADSQVIYAGCDVGGFFKSVDGGDSWRICNAGLHNYYVEVILPHPHDPRILYVGTEGGVHKSVDGGESWSWLRAGFPALERGQFSAPIAALAFDPQDAQVIYAGTGRPRFNKSGAGTVYHTTDGGATWQRVNPEGGGMDAEAIVSDLLVHPHDTHRLFAATDRGLYRSENGGVSWHLIEQGLPHRHIRRIALCAAKPDVMYLTLKSPPGEAWQGGVYGSSDGGESWSPRVQGLGQKAGKPGSRDLLTSYVDRLVVHPQRPEVVYAGDASWVTAGVYRTDNSGETWAPVFSNRSTRDLNYGWLTRNGPAVTGLAMDPRAPDSLLFSTSMLLFRSLNAGAHWTPCYTHAIPKSSPEDIQRWATTGLETTCLLDVVVHPREPDRLCLCYQDIGMIQSRDGGRTFAVATEGMKNPENVFTIAFDPEDPKLAFAGSGWWNRNTGDVCRSDDGGLTWTVVGTPASGLPDGQTRQLIIDRSSPVGARRVFVGVREHGVFCSSDGGATWTARNQGLPHGEIRALVQHPVQAGTFWAVLGRHGSDLGGVYLSEDATQSWRRVSGGFTCADAKTLVVAASDPQRLYLAARQGDKKSGPGGVFASRDGGANWERVLDDHFIQGLAVDPRNPDVVYAGGNEHPYHDEAIGLGVMASSDGGRTWRSLNSPSLSMRNIISLTLDPHQPNRLYAGSSGNGVFVAEV